MAPLSEILKSLVARNPEEQTVLQSIFQSAKALIVKGRGFATQTPAVFSSSPATELPHLLTTLPEESRNDFFGLVEALEIYESIHGTVSSLVNLNDSAVAELRKIRDICLQGGTHAYY